MNALKKYAGTVLIVSHDREFIDGIVDKVIEVKNKKIKTFIGNATDYLKEKENEFLKGEITRDKTVKPKTKSEIKPKPDKSSEREIKDARKELNKKIEPVKRDLKNLETEISKLEKEIAEIEKHMASEEFYKGGSNILNITNKYNNLKEKLKNVYSNWEIKTVLLNDLEKQLNNFKLTT